MRPGSETASHSSRIFALYSAVKLRRREPADASVAGASCGLDEVFDMLGLSVALLRSFSGGQCLTPIDTEGSAGSETTRSPTIARRNKACSWARVGLESGKLVTVPPHWRHP